MKITIKELERQKNNLLSSRQYEAYPKTVYLGSSLPYNHEYYKVRNFKVSVFEKGKLSKTPNIVFKALELIVETFSILGGGRPDFTNPVFYYSDLNLYKLEAGYYLVIKFEEGVRLVKTFNNMMVRFLIDPETGDYQILGRPDVDFVTQIDGGYGEMMVNNEPYTVTGFVGLMFSVLKYQKGCEAMVLKTPIGEFDPVSVDPNCFWRNMRHLLDGKHVVIDNYNAIFMDKYGNEEGLEFSIVQRLDDGTSLKYGMSDVYTKMLDSEV